jgi:hypothetical protein
MTAVKPQVNYAGVQQPLKAGDALLVGDASVETGSGVPTRTDRGLGSLGLRTDQPELRQYNGAKWHDLDDSFAPHAELPHGHTLTKKGVILQRGGSGAWDESLIHVPTVFWDPKLGKYRLMYDGFSGAKGSPTIGAIGSATSTDLETWTKDAANPILQRTSHSGDPDQNGVGQPFVFYENGTYYLFYVGTTATGLNSATQSTCLATSTDFATWTRRGAIVSLSGSGWRANALDRPHVVRRGSIYYLFIQGDAGIGYATSPDLLTWTVDDANSPILAKSGAGDEVTAIGDFSPYRVGDTWYATYLISRTGPSRRQGLAYTSDDSFPLGWSKFSGNPVLSPGAGGAVDAGGAARGGSFRALGGCSSSIPPRTQPLLGLASEASGRSRWRLTRPWTPI